MTSQTAHRLFPPGFREPRLAADSPGDPLLLDLSTREIEIIRLVAKAKTSKEIASRLGLSVRTVENHRASVMRKLGIKDAVTLTHYAIRNGLLGCSHGRACPLKGG